MSTQEGSRIRDLDLDVKISGNVQESYHYEVVEREMVKQSTIGKRERGKWSRGPLYHNIDMVSLLRVVADRGVRKQDPHLWMWLMMKELTARSMKYLGSSAERYQHRPVCSTGSKVVCCRGFTIGVAVRQVFLER